MSDGGGKTATEIIVTSSCKIQQKIHNYQPPRYTSENTNGKDKFQGQLAYVCNSTPERPSPEHYRILQKTSYYF
ncbi:unnamed protein product [Clavelina lepadiformis]|uniref:Uncharacterized protein n=1 Tax=Clavelina lepadiformis TaxID=159417 RepID=A0ABP0F618_CLALP